MYGRFSHQLLIGRVLILHGFFYYIRAFSYIYFFGLQVQELPL